MRASDRKTRQAHALRRKQHTYSGPEHLRPVRVKLKLRAADMSQIRSIQALRAIAALSVAFGHLQSESLTMPAAATTGYVPIVLDLTGAGVDLFFVISGFVMVYASRDLSQTAGGGQLFLKRRIARIVPFYWMMTTLFLLTMVLMPHALSSAAPTPIEILKSYLFIPYVHAGADVIRPVYKLGWTLNYEMFFYFVFAALLFLPMRWTVFVTAVLFSGLVALGATLSPSSGILSFWTNPIILEFVMGSFIALAFLHGWRQGIGGASALLFLGICGFAVTTITGLDAHGSWRPLLWGLPAALIVAAAALKSDAIAPAGRAMGFLVALGDASYALYLLHPMVIRALRLSWDRLGLSIALSPWIFIGAALVVLVPVALMVNIWIERPMTKYVQKLLAVRRSVAATAPAYIKM